MHTILIENCSPIHSVKDGKFRDLISVTSIHKSVTNNDRILALDNSTS